MLAEEYASHRSSGGRVLALSQGMVTWVEVLRASFESASRREIHPCMHRNFSMRLEYTLTGRGRLRTWKETRLRDVDRDLDL